MLNILDQKFISWVAKNKTTFLLLILISGNVYQYIEGNSREDTIMIENKRLNQVIQDTEKGAIDYERARSERLEFLLNNLSKSVTNPPNTK